jgi:hypothetical protein
VRQVVSEGWAEAYCLFSCQGCSTRPVFVRHGTCLPAEGRVLDDARMVRERKMPSMAVLHDQGVIACVDGFRKWKHL